MKKNIHPQTIDHKVTCSTCGKCHDVKSVKNKLSIDICSNCHPFYTGARTYNHAAGRVEKFNKKYSTK